MFGFLKGAQAKDTPAPPVPAGEGELRARFVTTQGELVARLFEAQAPRTVANFVALATGTVAWTNRKGQTVTEPLYNGTIFHRVIPDFMIQGGDPEGTGMGGPGFKWKDEAPALALRHDRPGLLSMANAGPDTNGSQFFLTEVPTPWLDGKHAVFGELIEGIDLVKKITRVPANQQNRPLTPVKLLRVEIFRA